MKTTTFFVYMLANVSHSVLYIGVTNDLVRRIYEHKNNLADGFTKHYNVHYLVYFEQFADPLTAIAREKQLKAGSRQKKVDLIKKNNPKYRDLYDDIQ